MSKQKNETASFQLQTIGRVQRGDNENVVVLEDAFKPGLKQLGKFSHLMVFWWAEQCDSPEMRETLQTNPPYAADHLTGVFACRSPYRPNPIAMSVCTVKAVDEAAGTVTISEIDAYDGTAVVDLKAYFPVCDRVQKAVIPEWLGDWPEWYPDQGIGIME